MFTLCRGGGSTSALVRQNIVRYTSMLDWKMDWYGGIDYGMAMYLIGWLASQSGLRGVLLGDFSPDCQIAKLKTLPNFPAIQYAIHILVHYYLCPTPAQPPDPDLLCPA